MVGFPLAEAPRDDKDVATGIVRTIVLALVVMVLRLWSGAEVFKVEFCKVERRKGHNKTKIIFLYPLRTPKNLNEGVLSLPHSGLQITISHVWAPCKKEE